MDPRVDGLIEDMKEAKAGLARLEVSAAEIKATLANLSTKADSATAIARIDALDGRTKALETAVSDTVKSAVGKAIGPWQLPAVLGACGSVVVLIVAAFGWLARQPWFAPHP